MKRLLYLLIFISISLASQAQGQLQKMSPLVRRAAIAQRQMQHAAPRLRAPWLTEGEGQGSDAPGEEKPDTREICVFVRVEGDATELFSENNCRELARFDDIYIVSVPIRNLNALSMQESVLRIEAGAPCELHTDTTALVTHAQPVYTGTQLPQAYTGRGVVVGIQDVGFDLTHPTFYSSDLSDYRIRRLWDMLSVENTMYVGAEYTTQQQLLDYAHGRDGLIMAHGTHTAGIAAGSGYDTNYRGLAWESDLCLVANAVVQDTVFVDENDYYKYTSATDALGFKYIFDYAASVGKPCVISFSEGSPEYLDEDTQLYYEVLEKMTGPGRIIVSSAGNNGQVKSYFCKPVGTESVGSFLSSSAKSVNFRLKGNGPFALRTTYYMDTPVVRTITSTLVFEEEKASYADTLKHETGDFVIHVDGYPSAFNPQEQFYEVLIASPARVGAVPVSIELVGADSQVEFYTFSNILTTNSRNAALNAGEYTHNINAPSAAPAVICVGMTSYRRGFLNWQGTWMQTTTITDGFREPHSSVGPTMIGRMKPDVSAPGFNIISSYNSFYREHNPSAGNASNDVKRFEFNGRTYPWTINSGTSMSSPVVGGAVALWLQANPTLTPAQVMEIISKTSRHTDTTMEYPNNYYGYGEIDVYSGLLEALKMQGMGIDHLSRHQPQAVTFTLRGQELELHFEQPLTTSAELCVYALKGALLQRKTIPFATQNVTFPLSAFPAGVYAVQINSRDAAVCGSTVIRKE